MIPENDSFNELCEFVKKQTGWKKLSRDTRLYEDLRIDGDDADDFFMSFGEKFDVSLEELNLNDFFNPEGFDPIGLSFLINKMFRKKEERRQSKQPPINVSITLGHLEEVVKIGSWFDPPNK